MCRFSLVHFPTSLNLSESQVVKNHMGATAFGDTLPESEESGGWQSHSHSCCFQSRAFNNTEEPS